jgi:hypothetical protein
LYSRRSFLLISLAFVDFHLRLFVEYLPSHIKDTTDYLKKMENLTTPENATLVTMDVTSLYTNILHDDGIAHAEKYGNKEQFKNLRQNA